MNNPRRLKKILFFILKLVVTLGAIAWFYFKADWQSVFFAAKQVKYHLVVLAFMIYMARLLPCARRWQIVCSESDYAITFTESFSGYLISGFFNTFLPTGRGGDLARALIMAKKKRASLAGYMGTILLERFVGLMVTVFIANIVCLFVAHRFTVLQQSLPTISLVNVLLILVFFLVIFTPLHAHLKKMVQKINNRPIVTNIEKILQVVESFQNKPLPLLKITWYSFLNQFVFILTGYFIAQAIVDFSAPWYAFAIVIPLVFVIELIPSIGGYGVRESGFVIFFGWFGTTSESAIVFSIIQLMFIWISGLIGALFFVLDKSEGKQLHRKPLESPPTLDQR